MMTRLICCLASLGIAASGLAQNPPPLLEWEQLDEASKQEYFAIEREYQERRSALSLTKEEREALTPAELRAHKHARWQMRQDFMSALAEKGFHLIPMSELVETVVAEMPGAAEPAPEDGTAESPQEPAASSASEETPPADAPVSPMTTGSVIYDDGVISTSFGGNVIVGNRFNTHSGTPMLQSGTVHTIEAVVVQGPAFTTSSAGFVLLGPQTTGGGAQAIFSTFQTAVGGATDTVVFQGLSVQYTGSSFFVLFGDFASIYVPAFGTGTRVGSVNGVPQGHHGVVGYTGGVGPNITSTFDFGGAYNALIRATGNIRRVIPVELMKFEIESEE